jgi:predicted 3-demethylubiquinone-9 3-methyltransferase (glyoxalase superfamily)
MVTGGKAMESAELLKRIRDELGKKLQVPDCEWKTARQWGIVWGLGPAQTSKMILQGMESGLMEMQRFRVSTPTRGSYPIPHYRCVSSTNPSHPSKSK